MTCSAHSPAGRSRRSERARTDSGCGRGRRVNGPLNRVDRIVRPNGRVFYGWWMVLAGGGVQLLQGALLMSAFGAYAALLRDDFGWSKGVLAGAFSFSRMESGLLGPLQGWMIDRFGPRAVMRVGIVLFGVGFMLFSRIDSLTEFYLTFFLMALGSSLGGFLSITVALVNWFSRHRSKALATSQIGAAIGGLLVPITVLAMEQFGWRSTAFASGVIILVVSLPLSSVIRHRPQSYGERVDGVAEGDRGGEPSAVAVAADGSEDFTAREAMRTSAFWFISLGHAASLLVVSTVMVHLVLHVNESLGYSLTRASGVVALMMLMQLIGQLNGGVIGDRFNKRAIVVACMFGHAAGLLLLAYASAFWMVLAFAVLHGLAWGTRGPLMQAMRADYFGTSSFGTIMGFSSLIIMTGMMTGPIFAGFMADRTGSYELGFTVLAVAAMFGSVFFMLASKPHPPRRREEPLVAVATQAAPASVAGDGGSGE